MRNSSLPLVLALCLLSCSQAWFWCYFQKPDIFEAAKAQDLEKIEQAVECGVSVDAVDSQGWTAMHYAASRNLPAVYETLLRLNARINVQDSIFGWSPLHWAASQGNDEMVRLFLRAGARPDILTHGTVGTTPLHLAASKGHTKVVELLLESGQAGVLLENTDPNLESDHKHGLDLDRIIAEGIIPAELPALNAGNYKEGHRVAFVDEEGNEVELSEEELPDEFKAAPADPHEAENPVPPQFRSRLRPLTALDMAAHHGYTDIMVDLLAYGVGEGVVGDLNRAYALHWAAEAGQDKAVEVMLSQGVRADVSTRCRWRPIHRAAINGHTAIVRTLLEHEAFPNGAAKKCLTPLQHYGELRPLHAFEWELEGNPIHMACLFGHLDIVKLLVEDFKADLAPENDGAWTPLHFAARHGYLEIAKYLLDKGHPVDPKEYRRSLSPYLVACMGGHLDMVELLLEKGAKLGSIDNDHGFSCLHWAAAGPSSDLVHFLLDKGLSPNHVDFTKDATPLHVAADLGNLRTARLLLQHGADPNKKDTYHWTPLYWADRNNHKEVVHLLEQAMSLMPEDVRKWDVQDVASWLKAQEMPHLVPLFEKHNIDGQALIKVKSKYLRETVMLTYHDSERIVRTVSTILSNYRTKWKADGGAAANMRGDTGGLGLAGKSRTKPLHHEL